MSSNDSHKSYRPLTVLSFRLNFALHGLHPWGYHLINVFLHGLVSALFFDVSVLVFDGDIAPAAAGSLLFAVHPIHTEAVSVCRSCGHAKRRVLGMARDLFLCKGIQCGWQS